MEKIISNNRPFHPDKMPSLLAAFWGLKNYQNVIAGINDDDCAVIRIGSESLVVSTDYLNANPIALEFGIATYKDLGKLLVAANLSDLCGTGAKPIAFLASIMFNKNKASKKDFLQLMLGIKTELLKYKIPLVGGDTKLGNANSFCGIAIGVKEKGSKLFLKSGAKPGDGIWVSGYIGSVAAAIDILQEKKITSPAKKWAISKIINPRVPLEKSRIAAKTKRINSGTDLSDGLGVDLSSLCNTSQVGAIIEVNYIPIEPQVKKIAIKKGIEPWKYAFTIGGDFQFIVSTKASALMRKSGFIRIGEITRKKELCIRVAEKTKRLPIKGHTDFNLKSFKAEVSTLINNIKN